MPRRESSGDLNEHSPLLDPEVTFSRDGDVQETEPLASRLEWEDEIDVGRKPWWYMFLLTLSLGGLQIVWSVELGSGSPYLLSLGMSKSMLAFVWIAGPLTGVLVQPYIGMCSDNCRISWGRRKPFMIGGGIATVLSLLALAWARDIVGAISAIGGGDGHSKGVRIGAIIFATVFMYIFDFAINTGKLLPHLIS